MTQWARVKKVTLEETELEKEEVALEKMRAEMLFVHREVRSRVSAPDWSDTHVASRCPPTSTQGKESSKRTDARSHSFLKRLHTHQSLTAHMCTRDATLVHCVVNNDSMKEFQWLRLCAVVVV